MSTTTVRAAILAAALGTMAVLAGCQSAPGAAAVVDGKSISSGDVSRYTGPATPPASAAQALDFDRRRQLVLGSLVDIKLYERALVLKGGPLSEADAATAKATALQNLQVTSEADLTSQVVAAGLNASFEPILVDGVAKQLAFAERVKVTDNAGLVAAIEPLKIPVKVSPRYGTWNATSAQVGAFTQPGFLRPTPTPVPASNGS